MEDFKDLLAISSERWEHFMYNCGHKMLPQHLVTHVADRLT